MFALALIAALVDVRAHIPNNYSFGSGPAESTFGSVFLRRLTGLLIGVGFVAILLWLAVRLVTGLL